MNQIKFIFPKLDVDHGWNPKMEQYTGKTYTVSSIITNKAVRFKEIDFSWDSRILIPVNEEKETEVTE